MKDEIKEILDNPKILMLSYGNYISLDDYVKLKDYITNLQKTNKNLKGCIEDTNINYKNIITNLQEELKSANESISWWQNRFNAVEKENERLRKDYGRLMQNNAYTLELEQRNEKAIEYIKEHRRADLVFKLYLTEQETDNVLNILQGGDK